MRKELIDQKFKKLSDVNKIRYNLGRMISFQRITVSIIVIFFTIVIGYLFALPFVIRYGSFSRIIIKLVFGSILIIVGFILACIEIFKFSKKDKEVFEKFLNEKSKESKK